MANVGKLVCEKNLPSGETVNVAATTSTNLSVVAQLLKITPGVGKPFYYWPSLPQPGNPAMVDYEGAPLATGSTAENLALLQNTVMPDPATVLTYAPPEP